MYDLPSFARCPAAWSRALITLVLALVALSGRALAFTPPPIQGHVTDTAGKLAAKDVGELNEQLAGYRTATKNEIAVLLVGSLGGETIEDVAYATFNSWRIGRAGLDNGVLLVIAPSERRVRIETGKGVGGQLPDLLASDIIRQRIGPRLKEERFREGIEDGVQAIMAALDGRPLPPLRAPSAVPTAPEEQTRAPAGDVIDREERLRRARAYDEEMLEMRRLEAKQREIDAFDRKVWSVIGGIVALWGVAFVIRWRRRRTTPNPWDAVHEAYARDRRREGSSSSSSSSSSVFSNSSSSSWSSSSSSSDSGYSGGGGSSGGGGASDSY